MCGIVGCAGNLSQPEFKVFRDMLLFDVVRGQDSTGVVNVPLGQGMPTMHKDIGAPQNLWETDPKNSVFNSRGILKTSSRCLIGHNRAATVGEVTVDNAHPFRFGQLYGVHNGSLWDTRDLEGNFDVDSKELYNTISERGIDHAWENLCGAAALVWWDHEQDLLCMIRNSERPLYTAWNKEQDVLFWASEAWMITVAAARNNVELEAYESGVSKSPTKLPIHTLKTFHPTTLNIQEEETRVLEPPIMDGASGWYYQQTAGHSSKPKTTQPSKPAGADKINSQWAKGLKKAGKEERGKKAEIRFPVKTYIPKYGQTEGYWKYYIIGEMETGERLEIYPETPEVHDRWDKIKQGAGSGQVMVRLKTRPRMSVANSGDYIYHIAAGNIELSGIHRKKEQIPENLPAKTEGVVNDTIPFSGNDDSGNSRGIYRGFGGAYLSSDELSKRIKAAGGCCAHCDATMDVEDNIDWVANDMMLCNECSANPYVQQLARGM